MKYNTTPITNIDDEIFVGGFSGVEFTLKPKETRYLPTDVSKHLADHLVKKLHSKSKENKEDLVDPGALKGQILGEEIYTAEAVDQLSFKEEVEKHEKEYAEMLEKKKRDDILNKKEALKEDPKKEETEHSEEDVLDKGEKQNTQKETKKEEENV